MPARAKGVGERALDPTEVIPGPQPLDRNGADEAKVISGEVVGAARHRGPRVRRPGPGSVGTAVLSATGAVAGLSLLMPHGGSSDAAAAPVRQPLKASAEDTAQVAPEPVATGSSVGAKAEDTVHTTTVSARTANSGTSSTATSASTSTSTSTSTSATSGGGRHARTSGTWDTSDWQEAVARAGAAQQAQQGQTGRHRAGGYGGQTWSGSGTTGTWQP
jgi:hypothetical protein